MAPRNKMQLHRLQKSDNKMLTDTHNFTGVLLLSGNFSNMAFANGHNGNILIFFSRAISTILYNNCLPTPLPLRGCVKINKY